MKVLVAAASKHGATADIAGAIGEAIAERGIDVTVQPVEEIAGLDGYDAVVLGSAVYAGRWRQSAKDLVIGNLQALRARPVWLFSSGPTGDPLLPKEDPVDAAPMAEATRARGHRVFAGKLDKSELRAMEKAIVTAVEASYGDYRNWEEIRTWAAGIAGVLSAEIGIAANP